MLIYSGAKAVTATLMHRLHERGALDINDPVAAYSPTTPCPAASSSRRWSDAPPGGTSARSSPRRSSSRWGFAGHAFGHLGFTNILAWADPPRELACAVITTGKPILYPELPRFYALMQRITETMPKVAGDQTAVWDPVEGRP